MRAPGIDEEELQLVYQWVDSVPLTRPKKNIARDFADGGMITAMLNQYSVNGGDSVQLLAKDG